MNTGMRGAWKLSLGAALAGVALSALTVVARADTPKDPYAVDIVGFHLGMSPDDVKSTAMAKIESAAFDVKQGTLARGNFRSPPMVFGVEVSTGRDPQIFPEPNKEYLYFLFDQRTPFKVISIQRNRLFTQDTAPTISQVTSSLIEKYGQPAGSEIGVSGTVLTWTYNSQIRYKKTDLMGASTCSLNIGRTMSFAGQLFVGTMLDNPNPTFSKCGTWMTVTIRPLRSNPDITGQITVAIGDLKAMRESDLFVEDMLTKGAAAAAAGQLKDVQSNKAPL